ncbi:uncharacterized protein KQ657_004294 [Scheffersomyces spartinae]|uniref:Uncharacterized protein n=1 Tax=Scheffersomyces spartinae TaxID=45513 RepID=A0A9P7VAW8_9ASCO|nr:uncharacterized protein KQ657_004294 [Scheffersomyces spartinae]KAG7194618.1 hypothetical protein KQ657_004294 [Scheffersomyces spartinae]
MGCDGTTPSWLMSVDLCGKAVDNFIVETEETVVRIKSFIKSITVRYVGILDTEEFDLVVNDLYQFCLLSDKFVVRIRQHQDLRKCDVGIIKDFIQSIDVLMIRYGRTIEWRQLLVHGDGDKKSILIPMEYIRRLPGAIKTVYDNYNPNTCKDHYSAMRQLGLQMTILRANRLKEECYSISLPKIENWQQLKESLTDDNNYSLGDLKLTLYLWGTTRGSGTIPEVSAAEKRIRDVCGCMEAHKENVLAFTRKFKQISELWLQLLVGSECEIPIRGGYIDYHDRITSMSEDTGTLMAQMEVQVF